MVLAPSANVYLPTTSGVNDAFLMVALLSAAVVDPAGTAVSFQALGSLCPLFRYTGIPTGTFLRPVEIPAAFTVIVALVTWPLPSLAVTVAVTEPLLSGLIGRIPNWSFCVNAP